VLDHVFGYLENLFAGFLQFRFDVQVADGYDEVYAVGSTFCYGVYVASGASCGAADLCF
jgi:hypothetical protein